jgi:hypothetical protein
MAQSNLCTTIARFVNSRERAYQSAKYIVCQKMAAITYIRRYIQYYSAKPEAVHPQLVRTCESQLLELLPAPNSNFSKLREKMLQLIADCKS